MSRAIRLVAFLTAGPAMRTVIARDVTPGEAYEGQMTLQAPPQPGPYELALDVVQEGVAWLSSRGAVMSFHPVRVE